MLLVNVNIRTTESVPKHSRQSHKPFFRMEGHQNRHAISISRTNMI